MPFDIHVCVEWSYGDLHWLCSVYSNIAGLVLFPKGIEYGGRRHKSWLASCLPSVGCPGDIRCALASTGASQVANWFVWVIILGGPSGDLQLVTLVALIALARTYGVDLPSSVCMMRASLDNGKAEG